MNDFIFVSAVFLLSCIVLFYFICAVTETYIEMKKEEKEKQEREKRKREAYRGWWKK